MSERGHVAAHVSGSEIRFEPRAETTASFRGFLTDYLARLEAEEVRIQHRAAELAESLAVVRRFLALLPSLPASESADDPLPPPTAPPGSSDAAVRFAYARRPAAAERQLPPLRATLFGEFRLYRADEAVRPSTGSKVWRVLKFLVTQGGAPVSRDVLADTFWRRSRGAGAAHSIHSAIHAMRRLLNGETGENYIVCDGGFYQFAPGVALSTDVAYYLQCLAESRGRAVLTDPRLAIEALERAVTAYAAPFLTDEPYERWAAQQRESLATRHLDVLGRLARLTAECGDTERAAEWHRLIVAYDPLREESHRALIEHYANTDQRVMAMQQYRTLEKELKTALGIPPDPRTRAALGQALSPERPGSAL